MTVLLGWMRGSRRLVAAVLLLAYLPGCHVWRPAGVEPQVVISARHPDQLRVSRVDGSKQVLHHPVITGDSLRGAAGEAAISLAEVRSVETRHTDAGRSLLLGFGIFGGVVLTAAALCAATDCLTIQFGK